MTAAIIVGAGRGSRMGGPIPKQYRQLDNMPIIRHTLIAFLRHPQISLVQAVIHPADRDFFSRATEGLELPPPVIGGTTRQESVRFGLESIAALQPRKVMVHDAVRPFVEQETISAVIEALDRHDAVITGLPVVDTLKHCNDTFIDATVDRSGVWRAQTPQGFLFDKILAAHQKLHLRNPNSSDMTDDSLVAESDAMQVAMTYGSEDNFKITTERDLERAERILARGRMESHVGFGFDFARLAAGNQLLLCGIPVPHNMGMDRDYNTDVPLNAVTDALTGTVGGPQRAGRIQSHLPRWRGVSSEVFVRQAVSLVAMKGGRIVHVDVTLLGARPNIDAYQDEMVDRVSSLLSIEPSRVSIKQVTFPGPILYDRADGISAQCLVTVEYPAL